MLKAAGRGVGTEGPGGQTDYCGGARLLVD